MAEGLKITPLSQDEVCVYLDLLLCVIQAGDQFAACDCRREAAQRWERKWRNVLCCEQACVSEARYGVKEQWRWDCTLSDQTRLSKSHLPESSLLGNRIFCHLPDCRGSSSSLGMFVNLTVIFSLSLNGLCGRLCGSPVHPFCGSPPPNAPLTTSTRPLRERCCGYFCRQWEALSHLCMRCRLTFLVLFQSLLFFLVFRAHIHKKQVFRLHLHARCVHLLASICAFSWKHASVFATAQTQGGKSNAVAMEL